ncbi:MAG: hypothetical protein ACFE9Z_10535 [Promethearchaeota archaeon]
MSKKTLIENELVRIIVEQKKNYTLERIEIRDDDNFIPLIGSNKSYSTLSYWKDGKRETKVLKFLKSKKRKIYYELNDDDFLLNLDYCLEESNIIHIRYKLLNKQDITLSKLGINYAILFDKEPDFTWVPHLTPKKDLVIGDHVFRSPVIIYKKGTFAIAFIPNLKTLGNNRPYQSFMTLDLKPYNPKAQPEISYYFGNYQPNGHVFFKHISSKKWEIKANTDLTFRFYIIIFKEKTELQILQYLNNFLWEKYGRKLLYNSLEPQILPYDTNVKEGFKVILERHNLWCNFKINNENCGGFFQRSWIGENKDPIKFVKQNELFEFTHHHSNIQRLAQIWNNAWFLNIRTAFGFRYFGEFWNDENLINNSRKMVNTVLNLPRSQGLFPSVIFPESYNSNIISTINGLKAFLYTDEFHVVDSCLAMYWALKCYKISGENRNKTTYNSIALKNLLFKVQLKNGAIPTYISFKIDKEEPIIEKDLINSAGSGAALMFSLELYKILKDDKIIKMCEKIAQFLEIEIIKSDKWHDFEPFYSCRTRNPDFYDEFTKNNLMTTL